MKRKKSIIIVVIAIVVCYILYNVHTEPNLSHKRIEVAYNYCKIHHMNTDIIAFCDFSIHSGKKRFIIYDTHKKKIVFSSLCAQGKGYDNISKSQFSNRVGSYCSSLGFYQIGYYHKMRIGCGSYILKGLSNTNSNALKRGILIHPYFTVSDLPVYPFPTSKSASKGCFVLSPIKFYLLKKLIRKHRNKPILLYAYK